MDGRRVGSPWLMEKDGNGLFNLAHYPVLIREYVMEVKPEIRKRALRRYHAKRWISRRGAGFAENEKKNDAIQKIYYQTLRSLRAV